MALRSAGIRFEWIRPTFNCDWRQNRACVSPDSLMPLAYASITASRPPPQNWRPGGSLLHSCRTLSFPTTCRLIPAHGHPDVPFPGSKGSFGAAKHLTLFAGCLRDSTQVCAVWLIYGRRIFRIRYLRSSESVSLITKRFAIRDLDSTVPAGCTAAKSRLF